MYHKAMITFIYNIYLLIENIYDRLKTVVYNCNIQKVIFKITRQK